MFSAKKLSLLLFAALSLICLLTHPSPSQAQEVKEEKTLKDIFDEGKHKKEDGTHKSGKELAEEFYQECSTSKDYFVTPKTQENYCACKASVIAQTLSPKEILVLKEDSKAGKLARDKVRINAEPACLLPAVKQYTKGICTKDKQFRTIILGKGKICGCVSRGINQHVNKNMTEIVYEAAVKEPMSLDTLSHYLRTEAYDMIYRTYKDNCYIQEVYSD